MAMIVHHQRQPCSQAKFYLKENSPCCSILEKKNVMAQGYVNLKSCPRTLACIAEVQLLIFLCKGWSVHEFWKLFVQGLYAIIVQTNEASIQLYM